MATGGVLADGLAQRLQQGLEQVISRFRQVPNRVWRSGCLAVLVLWLCYSLAQLFWIVMPTPSIPTPPLNLSNSRLFAESAERPVARVDIEELKSLALFGEGANGEQTAVAPATGIEQEAVDTTLQITLHGAIPSSNPERATAIIGDGRRQVSFNAGDELSIGPRGVRLAKVLPDRVILDNNGRYETLWLYSNQNNAASTSSSSAPPVRTAAPAAPARRAPRSREDVQASNDSGPLQMDERMIAEEQVRMVTDIMNVSMHREGGQLIGFRIRPKGNPELFNELGLRPNDIVTAVNNIGLDDTSRAMEVYRSLQQESRATLEILRDGTTITVDVALDQ